MFSRIVVAAVVLLAIQECCFAQFCGDGTCAQSEFCSCPIDCFCDPICGDGLCEQGENCNSCPDDCFGTPDSCCGNSWCESPAENCMTCPNDCFFTPTSCCGNGVCELEEDCFSCSFDCDQGVGICGDGVCEPGRSENCLNCPEDCNGIQTGPPADRFCCGDGAGQGPVLCHDPRCEEGGFLCDDSFWRCCGDGSCRVGECNCPLDCGDTPPATETNCGDLLDGDCDGLIDCDDPDCECCVPTHPKEKGPRCSDNIDNDCDGLIDCADSDCANNRACSAAAILFEIIRSAIATRSKIAD